MNALVVRPLAAGGIDEAFAWYEDRSVGLGLDFLRAVDESLAILTSAPLRFPVVHRGVRRVLIRRFPYALFYVVEEDRVIVLACSHTRRHPSAWRRRR